MKLPRAECPVCHASVSTRGGGQLREHRDHRHELYSVPGACRDGRVPLCVASGLTAPSPEDQQEIRRFREHLRAESHKAWHVPARRVK